MHAWRSMRRLSRAANSRTRQKKAPDATADATPIAISGARRELNRPPTNIAIIDANDAGCAVLGASPGVDRRFVQRLFADNPLGQAREQTPICLVREVPWPTGQELPAEPRRRLTPP